MNNQPELKTNELSRKLGQLNLTEDNTFALAGIERDAKKLLKTDSLAAYVIFGLIALHRKNHKETVNNFEKAITLNTSNIAVFMNYSLALNGLGLYNDALTQLKRALHLAPNNAAILKVGVERALQSGHFQDCIDFFNTLQKSYSDKNEIAEYAETYHVAKKIADNQINENELVDFLSLIEGICYTEKVERNTLELRFFQEQDAIESIFYSIGVDVCFDRSVELNDKLCDLLAQKDLPIAMSGEVTAVFKAAN